MNRLAQFSLIDSLIRTSLIEFGASGETRTLVGQSARQFTKLLLSLLSHAGMKWPAEP